MRRRNPCSRLILGAAVLAVGAILWLDRLHKLDANDYLRWWSVALIAVAVCYLIEKRWAGGAVLMLLGLAFLPNVPSLHLERILALTPLLISVAGVTLMMQALRPPVKGAAPFHAIAVMGGSSRVIGGNDVVAGDAIAVMSGCAITIAPETREAVIDVLAFWGGIEIRVPRGWNVETRLTSILGAAADRTEITGGAAAPRLLVRGSVIMGAVEVKHPREES